MLVLTSYLHLHQGICRFQSERKVKQQADDRALSTFWDESCAAVSEQIWFPEEIEYKPCEQLQNTWFQALVSY